MFQRIRVSKKFGLESAGGESRFFVEKIFAVKRPYIFLRESFCAVFQKLSGSKKFKDRRGGISGFTVEKFLSHSAKKFRRGNFLCCVSEKFR